HQAFVIARLRSHGDTPTLPRYRCVAAFHHQHCLEHLPIKATRRFITLVQQRDNAEIISSELRAMQGLYGRWGEEPKMPRTPAPCVGFLLAFAWSIDPNPAEAPYTSGVSFQ
ncbi:hypothetical protein BV25DRAFT_1780746, partial [Artomyces pyxidatus]